METTYSNQEKMILGLTAVFVTAFAVFFFGFKSKDQNLSRATSNNINYEMAKVKSSESLYSLDGREIDRENQELDSEIQTKTQAANSTNTKKINAKADAKIAAAKKSAAAQAAAKKTQVAQVAKTTQDKKLQPVARNAATEVTAEIKKDVLNTQSSQNNQATSSPVTESDDNQAEPKKNVKSATEWSKELFASEDRQTVLKFVSAYKSKEVSENDFYNVVQQLLASQQESKKGFGLYALRTTPSYQSFAALIKAQASLNSTYQTYVQDALLSYNQPANLNYLRQALSIADKQVVLKTLEIVKTGFNDVKNGNTSALVDARNKRDNDVAAFALQNYQSFLPQLAQLQQTADADVNSSASQLIQTIQATAFVASNP